MGPKWRDKAPHIKNLPDMGDCMIIDGLAPRPIAFEGPMIEMKARGEEIPKISDFRYDDCRPGSWDPDERLKDQDVDGVLAIPGVLALGILEPARCRVERSFRQRLDQRVVIDELEPL